MYRATTPTHTFTLPIQASDCKDILVTYSQRSKVVLEKYMDDGVLPEGMSLDGEKVQIVLTQDETNLFVEETAKVQIRILTQGGKACASEKFRISVKGVYNDSTLE